MGEVIEPVDGLPFDLEEFIKEKRASLDSDKSIERTRMEAALAFLELGELDKAQKQFRRSSEGFWEKYQVILEARLQDEDIELKEVFRDVSKDLLRSVYTGVLCGDEEYMVEIAEKANDELREEYANVHIEENGSDRYTELIRAITSAILENGSDNYFDSFDEVIEVSSRLAGPSYLVTYVESQLKALKGIHYGDEKQLRKGIEEFFDYQRTIESSEGTHPIEKCLSLEASALVALAQNKGINITSDSKYIPEKVYEIY